MESSPFDAGYTHVQHHHHQSNGVYGPMTGFESAGFKFHPGVYPDAATEAASFYQNYMYGATQQDYSNPRDPPSYAESTTTPTTSTALFHPGFVHTAAADYYKTGGWLAVLALSVVVVVVVGLWGLGPWTMVSDYHGVVRNSSSAMADNFLMKHEGMVGVGGGCGGGGGGGGGDGAVGGGHLMHYNTGRYSEEDLQQLHHHHHHHHQQQQQQHQQQHTPLSHLQQHPQQVSAPAEAPMPVPADLQQEDCKIEPDTQHEYSKAQNGLSMTSTSNISSLQHPPPVAEDHSNLPPPPSHDVTEPHAQSPCNSDVTSGEGTEATSGSQETDVNTSSEISQTQTQQEGNEGGEQGKNASSNEVKPTLSYIALIAKSILESPQRRLNLGSIYGWIEKNFPYYHNRGQGWRNSVRHNLSLNDCFIKAGRCEDGKGNYWAIHPANMQDFLRGDFRQRRRSRRRGRKKDCELGLYHHHQFTNGYLGASGVAAAAAAAAGSSLAVGTQMTFPPSAASLSNIYSPYTEAERRAYRLDEALLRQSMNNPFFKWYHQPSAYPPATSPSPANTGVYSGVGGVGAVASVGGSASQWPQGYTDNNGQAVYPLNSSFSRTYTTPAIV